MQWNLCRAIPLLLALDPEHSERTAPKGARQPEQTCPQAAHTKAGVIFCPRDYTL